MGNKFITNVVFPLVVAAFCAMGWTLWTLKADVAEVRAIVERMEKRLDRLEKNDAELRQWFILHLSGGGHLQPAPTVGAGDTDGAGGAGAAKKPAGGELSGAGAATKKPAGEVAAAAAEN